MCVGVGWPIRRHHGLIHVEKLVVPSLRLVVDGVDGCPDREHPSRVDRNELLSPNLAPCILVGIEELRDNSIALAEDCFALSNE